MTDYRCMFSASDRHCKLNQLRWQNMSDHLINETSYWLKKLLMYLTWAIYNVCGLNVDVHISFFLTLSHDRDRSIPLAQPEACPQRSERPVCARSPHRNRNGYPGCSCKIRKSRDTHAPGMPGTFSSSPRVGDPGMHHGTCVTHVPWCMPGSLTSGCLWSQWRGRRSRHSRRMRNPQFYVSGKRPMKKHFNYQLRLQRVT